MPAMRKWCGQTATLPSAPRVPTPVLPAGVTDGGEPPMKLPPVPATQNMHNLKMWQWKRNGGCTS